MPPKIDDNIPIVEKKVENMEFGDIIEYTFGYGKNKHTRLGEFKGYTDKNKVIFGRREFKDNIVAPKNIIGLFMTKEEIEEEYGAEPTEPCKCTWYADEHNEDCKVYLWDEAPRNFTLFMGEA